MPKFHVGRPPLHQLCAADGWKNIKTLDQRHLLLSLCIGISIGICMALVWRAYYSESLPFGVPSWTEISFSLLILSIGHEAIHLIAFPHVGLDSKTVIGIWPEAGSLYVQYMCPMNRGRFLVMSILPFLILSVMPFFLVSTNANLVGYLSWMSVLNCIGAGSDIFVFSRTLFTVPTQAKIIESEDSLYWHEHSA